MDKITLTKKAVNFVVAISVGRLVSNIIKNNTDPTKVTDRVAVITGGIVLGAMVADMSKTYTDNMIDEIVAWWDDRFGHRYQDQA